jgi:hypothetical protein
VRRLLLIAALTLALPISIAAAATDPHQPTDRFNPADMAIAKRAVVTKADLVPGWKQVRPTDNEGADDGICPNYDPDLSRFTRTAKAETEFKAGIHDVSSAVDLYLSKSHASAVYNSVAKPWLSKCFAQALSAGLKGQRAGKVSVRYTRIPGTGDRAFAFLISVPLKTKDGKKVTMFTDFIGFQKGRSLGILSFIALGAPLRGEIQLAQLVASRLP